MGEEKSPPPSDPPEAPADARLQHGAPRKPWWKTTLLIAAEVALVITLIFVIWATLLPTLKGVSPDAVRQPGGRGMRR